MIHTTEDERDVIALVELIEGELITVLERRTRMSDDPPRFCRHVALHSVVDLAGRLMLSMLEDEGDRARPIITAMVDRLQLLIAPPRPRMH